MESLDGKTGYSDRRETRSLRRSGREGREGTVPLSVIHSSLEIESTRELRRADRSDDADHPALAWTQLSSLHQDSSSLHDLEAFPSTTQDAFGHRGSSGRTHSRGA